MPNFYKYSIISALIIILLAYLLLVDDEINPDAKQIYSQTVEHTKTSNAYIYLMGFPVANKSPEVAGQEFLKVIKKVEEKLLNDPCSVINTSIEYPKTKEIPLLELNKCGKACDYIDKLFATNLDMNKINSLKPLYRRYNKFMALRDYKTITKPNLFMPFPNYRYIISGTDLINLMAIENANNKTFDTAIQLLIKNIINLRIYLRQADTLVDKFVYVSAISKSIDVLSVLQHKNNLIGVKLPSLSIEERSLELALNHEFAIQFSFSKAIDGCPSILPEKTKIPKFLINFLYKPNMTINSYFPLFKSATQRSLMNNKEFIKSIATEEKIKPKKSIFRNFVGSITTQSPPEFNQYIARLFALDAKIKLYNSISKQNSFPSDISFISNPFDEKKAVFYSKNKKYICFDMDFSKHKNDHCLRVRL